MLCHFIPHCNTLMGFHNTMPHMTTRAQTISDPVVRPTAVAVSRANAEWDVNPSARAGV